MARKLLQNPEIFPLEAAYKIQHKGVGVQLLLVIRQADGRVVVVGGNIQFRELFMEIRHIGRDTRIGGNNGVGVIPADDLALEPDVVRRTLCAEAFIVQQIRRIVPPGQAVRRQQGLDLLPVADLPAPDHVPPGFVELVQSAVLLFQPRPERRPAGGTGAVVVFQLVIDLPCENLGPPGVPLRHLLHDASGVLPEGGADHAAVAPDAQVGGPAVPVPLDGVRVVLIQP